AAPPRTGPSCSIGSNLVPPGHWPGLSPNGDCPKNGYWDRPLRGQSLHSGNHLLSFPLRRARTISLSDSLCLRRVRLPSVGTPQGVTGWRPPFDFPSPPPCGWSTGFMADPRTVGRLPLQRLRPALPPVTFSWSTLPTWPTVARHASGTRRISPEGRRRTP